MIKDGKRYCSACGRFTLHYTPDLVSNDIRCKICKSQSQLINLEVRQAKDGKEVVTWIARGTTVVAGYTDKKIAIKYQETRQLNK